MSEDKKEVRSIQDMDITTSPDTDSDESDEGETSIFAKWVRDRLNAGNRKKMVEVD